jgi:uroporphyrinogen decarboxylase
MLQVLRGEVCRPMPVWLMRQAGRYLPEYRALRAKAQGFLDLCLNPELAVEVTMQPIERFGFDAAILFADILLVPFALGQELRFVEGEGPKLRLLDDGTQLRFEQRMFDERLGAVFETVRGVRQRLDEKTALIGFAGAPWTVMTYMAAGRGGDDGAAARVLGYREPARFQGILDVIVEATVSYLRSQVEAGVEVLQIFESWASCLPGNRVEAWSIAPMRRIVDGVRERFAGVPAIIFAKGAGAHLGRYAKAFPDCTIGLDHMARGDGAAALSGGQASQGNLDPALLIAGGDALADGVDAVRAQFGNRPHIFNLGHGIWQQTPVVHVEDLVRLVRKPQR